MLDTIAIWLVLLCGVTGAGALTLFAAREAWRRGRARRLLRRVDAVRPFLESLQREEGPTWERVQRDPALLRDLEALEHLLEEHRRQLDDAVDAAAGACAGAGDTALYEAYERLGIVDRALQRLRHGRTWTERAFAARFLGELGTARAVEPLIAVLRETRAEDRDVRLAAGRALGRLRDPRAIEPLLDALALPESWLPARIAEVVLQFGEQACDPLLARLAPGGDPRTRAWAAEILGELGVARAVPALVQALRDVHDPVRARAAGALGKLQDRRAVSPLLEIMLSDPVPFVRIQAVRALGRIGDPRALHHLVDTLRDGEWWVRLRVVEALEQLGDRAREPLMLALEDADAEVRARAAQTLERLGELDACVERLAEGDLVARDKLLVAGQAGVVEILIEALSHRNPRVRYAMAEILGEVSHPAVATALLDRLPREEAAPIRAEIVRSLAKLREPRAAPVLRELLGDAEEVLRVEAVRALERIPMPEPHVVLGPALRDPQARVRAGAAAVLGKAGDEGAVPHLVALLGDCDAGVRAEAARALGLLHATAAIPRLLESFHDAVPEVQVAVARALGQIGDPVCLETLVRGLEGAPEELGSAIAWALGQIPFPDPEAVIDVLFQGADRTSRLAALDVLGQLEHDAARELVRAMLEDGDEVVVVEALRQLARQVDPAARDAVVAMLRHPRESVRLAALETLCAWQEPSTYAALRQVVFDPAAAVRERAVLALAYLADPGAGDLLRGILVTEQATTAMRGYALLGLMRLDRDGDLDAVLEGLESFALHDFLHARERRDDMLLRTTVERLRGGRSVEYRVATLRSRTELVQELQAQLAAEPAERVRAKIIRTLDRLAADTAFAAVRGRFYKDPSPQVRVAALEFVARRAPGEDRLRVLLDGMTDVQTAVRAAALAWLRDVEFDQALPIVQAALQSDRPEEHEALVTFASGLSRAQLEAFLDGIFGLDLDARGRRHLAQLLGKLRSPAATALLETFLDEDAGDVRRAAVLALSRLRLRRAARHLEAALQDPDVAVRREAVRAAGELGRQAAAALWTQALDDPDAEVRRVAAQGLGRADPTAAREALRRVERDPEPAVRAAALAALALGGEEDVETRVAPADLATLASAVHALASTEDLEQRLRAARRVAQRIGALRGLFFVGPRARSRALEAARRDPSRRVRAVGERLEAQLQAWLLDPQARAVLETAPAPAGDTVALGTAGRR